MFLILVRISCLCILLYSNSLNAFSLDKKLPKDELESRAVNLFKVIRCPVCIGESVYNSQSEFAENMRILIRNKINLGNSDQEILDQLKKDYGDQIINISQYSKETFILWYTPLIVFVIGVMIFIFNSSRLTNPIKKSIKSLMSYFHKSSNL